MAWFSLVYGLRGRERGEGGEGDEDMVGACLVDTSLPAMHWLWIAAGCSASGETIDTPSAFMSAVLDA